MEKSILIAASNYDEHAYGPVTAILDSKGFNVVTYLTDKALSGEDDFHVYVNEDAEVQLAYNGQPIDVENIGAAWFRKLLAFEPITSDPTKKLYINSEILHLHDTIWDLYPDNLWLNSPNNIKRADRKIRQLQVAKLAGFTIPPTIISSTWENIEQNLMPNYDEDIIVKTIRGIINDEETIKAHFTTVLTHEQILAMKNSVSPYLGLYQPFIDKLREWRVTVVGNDVHSASIETDLAAKDDWRKLQNTESVRFKRGELPDEVSDKCIRFLGSLGLKYGAFDLIETPENEIVFLECNPNGQYGWLEKELGLPISQSIASELINIFNSNKE